MRNQYNPTNQQQPNNQQLGVQSHNPTIEQQVSNKMQPEMITDKASKKLQSRTNVKVQHNSRISNVDANTINEMKRKLDVMLKQTEAWENLHARKLSVSRSSRNLSIRSSQRRSMREGRGNSVLGPKWRIGREQQNYSASYQQSEDDRDSVRSIPKSTATDRENKRQRVSRRRDLITQDRESSCELSTRNKQYLQMSPIFSSMDNPEGELSYEDHHKSPYEPVFLQERSHNGSDDHDDQDRKQGNNSRYFERKFEQKSEQTKLKELQQKYQLLLTQNKGLKQNLKQYEISNKNYVKNMEKEHEELLILQQKMKEQEQKIKYGSLERQKQREQIKQRYENELKMIESERNESRLAIQRWIKQKEGHIEKLQRIEIGNQPIIEQHSQNNKENMIDSIKIKQIQIKQYVNKIEEMNRKIQIMKKKMDACVQQKQGYRNATSDRQKQQSFDSILMDQIQQISKLKQQLQAIEEQIVQTKQGLREKETSEQKIGNEIRILEMKYKSQINNKKLIDQIKLHQFNNAIDHFHKKIQTLEDKYASIVTEINLKNNFLKQHLIGRVQTEPEKVYIQQILQTVNSQRLW